MNIRAEVYAALYNRVFHWHAPAPLMRTSPRWSLL